MAIQFDCPLCAKRLKAPDEAAGRQVRCTRCRERLRVPRESGLPAEVVARKQEEPEEEVVRFSRRWKADDEVDMTPMIDMTFLLLIFFMVTASFALQKSLEIPAPQATDPSRAEPVPDDQKDNEVVVTIEADDNVLVNDEPAPTRNELIAQLREAREGGTGQGSKLRVQASGDARHETVVMVLDVGSLVGMDSVELQIENEEE